MPDICAHYLGGEARHCSSPYGVRLYLPGPRCPDHTPSALQGKPEPDAHTRKGNQHVSWLEFPMVAFDLETTGVDVETDRIVTASIITINGAQTYATHWLVNPGVPIPDAAAAIHGVTTEKAQAEGAAPAEAIASIVNILASSLDAATPVVTMNGVFDLTILDRESRRHGVPTLSSQLDDVAPILDVRVLDKRVDRYRKGGRKLADLCKTYEVKHDGEHNASEDALAAARVLWRIAQRYPEIGQRSPRQLHDAQIDWYAEQAASFAEYRRRQGQPLDDESTAWPIRPLGVTV